MRLPPPARRNMPQADLSLTEWTVLGILGEGSRHGFAIARELRPDRPIGRVLTVRQPLAYRALDRLVAAELSVPLHREQGEGGPQRTIHRISASGRRRLSTWLMSPVAHIREMRLEFLVKLTLIERSGRSGLPLIQAQRAVLAPTLAALTMAHLDPVERWRYHNARAVAAFLDDLEADNHLPPDS